MPGAAMVRHISKLYIGITCKMAINLITQYPGKVAPVSPQYPYGQPQNITVPGDDTGTPWEAAFASDIQGFFQAMMSAASVAPTGTPDAVGGSQYLESLMRVMVLRFPALTDATNSTIMKVGMRFSAVKRSGSGDVVPMLWDSILTGTTAGVDLPNGMNIVVSAALPSISFVLVVPPGGLVDPRAYGAVFDNVADIGPELNAMLLDGVIPSIPNKKAVIDTQVNVLELSTVVFQGAQLRTTIDTITMFRADMVNGWSLLGKGLLKGTAPGAVSAQLGVHATGCLRYVVENIEADKMRGHGFLISPGPVIATRAEHGVWTAARAYECQVGWEFEDGTGSEYTVCIGCSAVQNVTGVKNGSGNTNWVGGNITDNTINVELYGGSNANHGIFAGVHINHGAEHNLLANDVANGYSFIGCHWYADGPFGSGTGKIEITNSKKIQLQGGQLACPVIVNKGVASKNGHISIRNMEVPEITWVDISGDDQANITSKGHYDEDGLVLSLIRVAPPTYVSATVGFSGTWVDHGAGRAPAGYKVDEDNNLRLSGAVKDGSAGTPIFTLPVGYRTDFDREFVVVAGAGSGLIIVTGGTGVVSHTSGATSKVYLDGIVVPLIG